LIFQLTKYNYSKFYIRIQFSGVPNDIIRIASKVTVTEGLLVAS
jgi:hypothetical protein